MRSHGRPSIRQTVSYFCHRSEKTAPCARTARRKDDVFRPVSWLRGSLPFLAFPGLSPVASRRRINRSQLRAQLRIWPAFSEKRTAPNSLLPVDVTDKPERCYLSRSHDCCQFGSRDGCASPFADLRGGEPAKLENILVRAGIFPAARVLIDNTDATSMIQPASLQRWKLLRHRCWAPRR